VIELGLPFSDPTADGPVIAAAAQQALGDGVNLDWVLSLARERRGRRAGLVLMSYLNPLLARGLARAIGELRAAGFEGLIVPDLPLEEGDELRALADEAGLSLIQLVTPVTSAERRRALARASRGFLYAVTRTGITGGGLDAGRVAAYLAELRGLDALPVCAGFGVRSAADVRALRASCDGLVVGTALVERIGRGEDPVEFLATLEAAASAALESR